MTQRNTRKTTEEFIREVNEIRDDIELLDEYPKNRHTKMTVKCKKCGNIFSLTPRAILRGTQCSNCRIRNNNRTRTFAGLVLDLFEKNESYRDNLFEIIDDELNNEDKILLNTVLQCRCKECGRVWKTTAYCLLDGTGCDHCNRIRGSRKRAGKNCTLDTFEFYKRVLDINPKNCCIELYTNKRNRIKTQCGNCGYIWFPYPDTLLNGGACPRCNKKSKGERKIENYLINNNIDYIAQKTFEGLNGVGNRSLSYDFYLPKYNLLIEYQGEFHDGSVPDDFQPVERKEQQFEHDKRKREYAKNNNIDLLEIWYKDFDNVEDILENKIKQILNKIKK